MPANVDITNQKFGRLIALYMTDKGSTEPRRDQRWLFRCDCGNEVEALKWSVRNGLTRSCGCLQRDVARRTGKQSASHGHTRGGKRSPEYSSWRSMHDRCGNPKATGYERWGGRGITVCERWHDFEAFLSDMGSRPSLQHELDRINNNGNYEPGNVRWATPVEQNNNTSANRLLTIGGRAATIAEHARAASIPYKVLHKRVNDGWSPEILAALLRIYRERAGGGQNGITELRQEAT
jgi:hypothetical protein